MEQKDCIIEFRDTIEKILVEAGIDGWSVRFDTKNKIVDAAIKYGETFARECLAVK